MFVTKECTVKAYTIKDAFNAAKIRLPGRPICVNAIRGRSYDTKITLHELNELADQLVSDTLFYD